MYKSNCKPSCLFQFTKARISRNKQHKDPPRKLFTTALITMETNNKMSSQQHQQAVKGALTPVQRQSPICHQGPPPNVTVCPQINIDEMVLPPTGLEFRALQQQVIAMERRLEIREREVDLLLYGFSAMAESMSSVHRYMTEELRVLRTSNLYQCVNMIHRVRQHQQEQQQQQQQQQQHQHQPQQLQMHAATPVTTAHQHLARLS